ncbi:acyltransferase family protein [Parapedobacter defluvii]|uniref:acyltransferase family protein n=1 Tax=Parapedobacter defluvii TaxID=2045106 RepID=UPI00333F1A52
MQFRNDIQGLRAIAFFLVFLFHLKPDLLPGGYIGVDMFFVISGYLISTIVLNQLQKNKFSLVSFYEKRIKRIAPAYFFMLIAVAFAGYFTYLPTDAGTLRGTLVRSALFISNVLFANGESYFGAQSHENPLLHTWSLAIEMQFYIFLPLLLLFVKRKSLLYIILILILGFTVYSSWQIYVNGSKTAMYFSLLARIPEFLIGTLFSLISLNNIKFTNAGTICAVIGSAGLLVSSFFLTANSSFPGILSLIPCISIGLILISGQNIITSLLSLKPLVQIGEWSYSLYLWHWPIMAFMRYKMISFGIAESIIIISLTFILSYLSYTLVENKFRALGNKAFIKAILPVSLLVGITAYFIPIYANAHRLNDSYTKPVFGLKSHKKPFVETLGSESPAIKKRILLIGNSHAMMTKPFLDYVGKKAGFSFHTITSASYPAIRGLNRDEVPIKYYNMFDQSSSLISLTEQEIKKSDIIIFVIHDYCNIPSIKDAMVNLIKSLAPNQLIVLVKSFPRLETNPVRVNYNVRKVVNYDFKTIDNSCSRRLIKQLDETYLNVYSFDLTKSKVFDTPPFFNDTLSYYDEGHINTYASIEMAKDLYTDFSNFIFNLSVK